MKKERKNTTFTSMLHQLCHEMKHDNQKAFLICKTRIEMLVKVSHNHGMNMKTWWQCSYLEGDDDMSISCGALWKHHKRPFVVNCFLLDIACCMVFWFHRNLVHMWIIWSPKKKIKSANRCEIMLMLLISIFLFLSFWPYLLVMMKVKIGKMGFVCYWSPSFSFYGFTYYL
jgi:hypothetical protein